ncbi:MAG: hypothetical protein ABJF10_12845 [Chthoniobacter sp.]|uniref:hypothetical protein n=1 Tax=Chthoniobacter sp. TaxID=2510640 RepID=UPI0032A3853E
MPSFHRDQLHICLSILLMVALTAVGCADQTPDPGVGGKNLQLHREAQFVMSAPALEIKTGARKAASSWSGCVECLTGHAFEYGSAISSRRPDGEGSPQMRLADLRALRGRAPPLE